MILVVTGGRDYRDKATLWRALDRIHATTPIRVLVHGACGWDLKPAGPERNHDMLRYAMELGYSHQAHDVMCLVAPGGRGTRDCAAKAREAGFTMRTVAEVLA